MSPIVLLFKSLVPAHTRRLKTGKVVNVRQYTDKRTKRLEDDKTLDMFADDGKDDLFGDAPEPVRNLSFADYLKRGDAKGATDKLRGMSYQEAQEAALRAGFSMPHIPKDKRRDGSGVVAALADQLTRAAAQKTDGFGLRAKPKDDDPETALRATWAEMGVPKSRQDELIAQIADKAKPGAKVGPWTIGGEAPKPKDTITTPRQEMIDEHKRLVDVLESPSRTDDKAEAKKQKEELEEYEGKPTDDTPQIDAMIARAKSLGFDGIGIKASLELYRNGKNPGQGVTSREEGIANLERMLAAAEAKAKPAPKVTAVTRKESAMAIGQRVTLARARHDKYVGMSGHVAAHIKSRGTVKIALDNGEYYEALPANIDAIDDGVTGAGYAKVQADKAKREAAAKRREERQEQARIEAEKQKNAAAKMADRVTAVMPGVPESDHKKIMNAVQRARRGNAGAHVVVSHYGHPFNYVEALPFNTLDAAQKYVGIKKDEDFRSKGTHGVFSPRVVSVKSA